MSPDVAVEVRDEGARGWGVWLCGPGGEVRLLVTWLRVDADAYAESVRHALGRPLRVAP